MFVELPILDYKLDNVVSYVVLMNGGSEDNVFVGLHLQESMELVFFHAQPIKYTMALNVSADRDSSIFLETAPNAPQVNCTIIPLDPAKMFVEPMLC